MRICQVVLVGLVWAGGLVGCTSTPGFRLYVDPMSRQLRLEDETDRGLTLQEGEFTRDGTTVKLKGLQTSGQITPAIGAYNERVRAWAELHQVLGQNTIGIIQAGADGVARIVGVPSGSILEAAINRPADLRGGVASPSASSAAVGAFLAILEREGVSEALVNKVARRLLVGEPPATQPVE